MAKIFGLPPKTAQPLTTSTSSNTSGPPPPPAAPAIVGQPGHPQRPSRGSAVAPLIPTMILGPSTSDHTAQVPFDTGTPGYLPMTPITPQQQHQLPHGEPLPNTIPAPSLTGNGQGIVHGLDLDRSFEDKKRVRINPDVSMPDAPLAPDVSQHEIILPEVSPEEKRSGPFRF